MVVVVVVCFIERNHGYCHVAPCSSGISHLDYIIQASERGERKRPVSGY